MVKLTNEQIVEICENVIEKVKNAEKNNKKIFLCYETSLEISRIDHKPITNIYPSDYIYQFTNENARKYANAKIYCIWWKTADNNNKFNYSDRIKFMEWIKSQYQNK